MSGGSRQPESDRDVRCSNCGRCYSNNGIYGHEPSCPLKDVEAMVVPRDEWDEADALEESDDVDVEAEAPAPSEPGDVEADREAVTDGAGLGLDGPPAATTATTDPTPDVEDVDVEETEDVDNDNEPGTYDCLDCGDDLGVTDEDLRARTSGRTARVTCDCGEVMRWTDE